MARVLIRILKWTGIALGAFILIAILWYLFIFDWNDVKDQMATAFGERTHREFSIGKLDVRLALTPHVHMEKIQLQNAPWSEKPQMVEIGSLDFTLKLLPLLRGRVVLPEVALGAPHLILERNKEGVPNWDFSASPAGEVAVEAAVPEKRTEFPIIGRLAVTDGEFIFRDPARNIDIQSQVNTVVGTERPGQEQVRVKGQGHFEGLPFSLDFVGGSLLALREDKDPYPLNLDVRIGETEIEVQGTAIDPLLGEGLDLTMDLKGQDLAEVFPIFGIPFPPSRPYHLAGKLTRDGTKWGFLDFSGKTGESDLSGDAQLDFAPKPPYLSAQVVSKELHLSELAGFFGVRPGLTPKKSDRLIPATPINLKRFRAMNMDVEFRGERVVAAKVPTERMESTLHLKDGQLRFDPLNFDVAQGTITGTILLDASRDLPSLNAELRLRQMHLGRFLPKLEAAGLAYGIFGGRVVLKGSGETLREIIGRGDGGFWLSMSGGAVDEIVLAAAGVDVPDLLRLLGEEKSPVPLRCSVMAFDLNNGLMTSNVVVIDAQKSTLFGEGKINLRNEKVDLQLDSQSKEATPLSVNGTIEIDGTLRKPAVGLDLSGAAGQAGVAAALGAILTPLAAILPFIDPGTGEDTECSELFSQASRSVEKSEER